MNFSLYHLVVIYYGTPFKGTYVAMYKTRDLNYDILAKRNYKGLTIENSRRFLNKRVTITMEDRQSNDVFILVGIDIGLVCLK